MPSKQNQISAPMSASVTADDSNSLPIKDLSDITLHAELDSHLSSS